MKKRFLPLSMLLITIVLAQASIVANATGIQGNYTPRTASKATFSSFMKSIRANQETGLIDPALLIEAQKEALASSTSREMSWISAGPDNFGGFTRGLVFDKDGNVVIGTSGGDIFKTTNGGVTFKKINTNSIEPISCMVVNANGDIFIGTGDGRSSGEYNGIAAYDEYGFIGNGVYKLAAGTTTLVHLASTTATYPNEWCYVNELTISNNKIYAATEGGLYVSENNGDSWTQLIEGSFLSVKANASGDLLATDAENVYLAKAGNSFQMIPALDDNTDPKIIAMSPSDAHYMYIAHSDGTVYFTKDGGTTWEVALTAGGPYDIFAGDYPYEATMIVYPDNPKKLLIGSEQLTVLEDITGSGANSYRPIVISDNSYEYVQGGINPFYLHRGIQSIAFNPTTSADFFVGTEGGIFKGEYRQMTYTFRGGNRYFLTETEHCSPARMMSVGVGGTNYILGGNLDHGTILLENDEYYNNVTTGLAIFPNQDPTTPAYQTYGYFTPDFAGGPCAVSTIDPNSFFVSTTGSLSTPIYRTYTGGYDYDNDNFKGGGDDPVVTNANAFRTPFAFYETYNDTHTSVEIKDILSTYNSPLDTLYVEGDTLFVNSYIFVTNGTICVETDTSINIYTQFTTNDTLYELMYDTTLYVFNILHDVLVTTDIEFDTLQLVLRNNAKAGEERNYYSKQGNYPISYTLPEPPHDDAHIDPDGGYMWIEGDTIKGLHDPLKTNYVCAVEGKVYMTRDALIFNKATDWFQISTITGIPSAVTISSDGTTAYVGTVGGNFYKFSHIDDAFTVEQASISDTLNICVEMTTDETTFAGRAITSISVNPSNNNEVMVTLGNYGNTDYVYVSNDAGASFTALAGLPAAPVYAGLIEKATGLYIVGTEHGIFTSENGTSWSRSGNSICPVMDIKQAYMENHDDIIDILYDEMGNPTYVIYPGISNEGMIFAATYGNGIMACGEYKEGADFGVDEIADESTNAQISVYPNPVKDNAQFNFTMTESANVYYQIYDISGRMVTSNILGFYGAGEHSATINMEDLTSGSYIIRVIAGNNVNTGKFLVY